MDQTVSEGTHFRSPHEASHDLFNLWYEESPDGQSQPSSSLSAREFLQWEEQLSTCICFPLRSRLEVALKGGNKNIVLATTTHGGHLGYYERITATSMWWVRAVEEYFKVLLSTPFADRKQKTQNIREPLGSLIDQGPFVVDTGEEGGMVAAAASEEVETTRDDAEQENGAQVENSPKGYNSLLGLLKKRVNQLARSSHKSIWLLAYIAIFTTWPLLGPALLLSIKKRFRLIEI